MDNMDLYSLAASSSSLCHLMESEEDFPLGAKTTSFLPPATVTNASTTTTTTMAATRTTAFDLPEWMEGRELLELPDVGLFDNLPTPQPSTALQDTLRKLEEDSLMKLEEEEDYSLTIKPEDMLVPLSELQPPTTPTPPLPSTPPASPLHFSSIPVPASPPLVPASPPLVPASPPLVPASLPRAPAPVIQVPASAPLPKIIICRKVDTSTLKDKPVRVHYQVMPAKQVAHFTPATHFLGQAPQLAPMAAPGNSQGDQVVAPPLGVCQEKLPTSSQYVGVPQISVSADEAQPCDAEELINEMVQMIGNNSAGTFFPGIEVDEGMEELLLKLEASNKALDTEPVSQASLSVPVPVPSVSPNSLAPASPHPSEASFSGSLSSPAHTESTFPASPLSLPSPVPSMGSLSPAPSTSDSLFLPDETSSTEDCLEEWSPLEETHSYSKSTRKARPSRRSGNARKTPYPEDRKERKKEQNKQAALRYRQKKKQEEDDMLSKIEAEEERQEELKAKYQGLRQELNCLKKIMREMFVAKGMLSEEALKKAAQAKKEASK